MNSLQAEVGRLADVAEAHLELRRREDERARQRIGSRSQLRQLHFGDYSRAVPGLAAYFERKVPAQFWTLADARTAEISCPCGETPATEIGVPVECGCGRFYLYDGRDVRVGGGPKA